MKPTFNLSRATKPMLRQRLIYITRLYNELVRDANSLSDEIIPFTADAPIRQGDTIMVRVPKHFRVRNR